MKNNKNLVNKLKFVILAVGFFIIITSNIVNAQTVTLSTSSKNNIVKNGDKIDVIISKDEIDDNYQIDGKLNYDENILELQTQGDGKKYTLLDNNVNYVQMNDKNEFTVISDKSDNKDIIKFTFLVKKGAKFENTSVKISRLYVSDYNLNAIESNSTKEVIIVKAKSKIIINIIAGIMLCIVIILAIKKIRRKKQKRH